MQHRVIFGDAQEMPELKDESVHLIVTSPPYWAIKDYGVEQQIGFGSSYEDYLSDLGRVFKECYRVLHGGCKMAVNIGDQYLSAKDYGRYHIQPIGADLTVLGREVGMDFMGAFIWNKVPNCAPSGGAGAFMGSLYHPRDGAITFEHEYILLFKKQGKGPKVTEEQKANSEMTKEQRSEWFRGVWRIAPARQKLHKAMFPVELPDRLIRMYSFWGETVLDPFMGSGTTAEAAELAGRNSVGFEINQDFKAIMEQRPVPFEFEQREMLEESWLQ